ncbi:MAG: ABC transporter substrate-binding protein, partial [Candidatus Marinimicrobia bacterium]|nr:ABC transporter substrate-binding protein [Candidatus Neomarinimicrobiota bacterium]
YPAEIPEMVAAGELVCIGGFVDLSMSRVDSLKPDLVLTATGMQLHFHDFLKEKGIPFIHMEETSLAETYEKVLALGAFINKKAEAGKLVESIKSELVSMEQEYAGLPCVKVYYEINYAYKCVPGADSYIVELMRMVGADPIYADRPGIAPSVTWDDVLAANPEVILIPWWETAWQEGTHFEGPQRGYGTTSIGEVAAREGAQTLAAVKTGKIRYINSAKTKQAGPMIPTAVRLFAEAIHAPGRPERMQMDFVPQLMEEQDTFVPELETAE